jgi:uncharacterized protein involved in exopolysaccharide biosynthesis
MDVQTAATLADLRQQLEQARTEADFLRGFANNPDMQKLRDERDAARQALNDTDLELAKSMIRADVLAAEVVAWHAWDDKYFDELATAEDARRAEEYLDACIVRTVDTNALDSAKFEGKP